MSTGAPITLEIEHCHAFAAWFVHGPGTVRQVAGKADVPLTMLHPRTAELHTVGALAISGQSATEGPIYQALATGVHIPSDADRVERVLTTLEPRDQVSIAAGVMARLGKKNKAARAGDREQAEMPLG